jgi:hypothetical protein
MGTITLIGSGEMSPGMSKTHREVISAVSPPLKPVFLDTPAGFQLNVDQISEKAIQYFKKHFNLNLTVASFKSAKSTNKEKIHQVLLQLKTANYIFAGPGSPTYVVKNWKGTEIINALHSRLNSGAHLVLASAASIAMGSFALPVYEIYKVGDAPHWVTGLDFFKPYGYQLAVIPHWNNKEGGTHDTRFCYMGEARLKQLEKQLPKTITVLGIDEYTALKLDFSQNNGMVLGAGNVTIQIQGQEMVIESGKCFDMKYLRDLQTSPEAHDIQSRSDSFVPPDIVQWPEPSDSDQPKIPSSLINLLVDIRSQFRNEQKWDMADHIREKLLDIGIILEDGMDGTTWRKG